jgi:hypothetical protein
MGNIISQRRMSPDRRAVATFGLDGRFAIYPIDGGTPHHIESIVPGWFLVQWSRDGRFLYVGQQEGSSANIYRVDPVTGRRELWKKITPSDTAALGAIYAVHIADDEQSYFYSVVRHPSDLYLVRGLR